MLFGERAWDDAPAADWLMTMQNLDAMHGQYKAQGRLVGQPPPAAPTPPSPLASLVGRYASAYYGDARIELNAAGDALQLVLGPAAVRHGLRHWDGDVFTFAPQGESATPGSISALTFTPGQMQIERYAEDLERGRFQRVADRP